MASTDALPIPRKNVAFRVTFPILDNDGDLVTGAAGLDSEVSKDGGTFANCTNEATEIATSSGMYYLDLTSTEMNADTVAIIVKTSTADAKTTTIVIYPAEDAELRASVRDFGGTAGTFASGRPEVNTTHINNSAAAAQLLALVYAGIAVPFTVSSTITGAGDFVVSGASLSSTNDVYNDQYVVFTSGANRSIARMLTDWVGSGLQMLFNGSAGDIDAPFPDAPSAGDTGFIVGLGRPNNN